MSKISNDSISLVFLFLILLFLISAVRLYIGGPDHLELVWKDQIGFGDTVVNVNDYAALPREELDKKPGLSAQMEDMGLIDFDDTGMRFRRMRAKRRKAQAEKSAEAPQPAKNLEGPGDSANKSQSDSPR